MYHSISEITEKKKLTKMIYRLIYYGTYVNIIPLNSQYIHSSYNP